MAFLAAATAFAIFLNHWGPGVEKAQFRRFPPVTLDRSDDLRRRSIAALSKVSFVVLLDRAIQLVSLAVTARLLLPAEIAIVAASGATIGIVGMVTALGVPAFLIQVATFTPAVTAAARNLLLVGGVLGLVLVEIFAPAIASWFKNPPVSEALRVMALILIAPILSAPAAARLSRDLRARDIALADLIANSAGVFCVTIPLALLGFGFWAMAWGAVAQVSLRTVILCLFARQPFAFGADLSAMRKVVRHSSGFMFNVLLSRVESNTPHWVIGRVLPSAQLGLFSRANSLMNYPAGLFYSVVDRVIFPAVALVQNQMDRLREGALDAVRLTAIVGIPLAVTLFCLGADLIRVVLGPNWAGAAGPFQILAVGAYFKLAGRVNWIVLSGMGKTYRLAVVHLLLLGVTIGGCVLGARWGLEGVAAAVTTSICASYLASGILAMRAAKIPLRDWLVAHGHGLAWGVLAAAVLAPLAAVLDARAFPSIAVLAACAVAGLVAGGLAARLAPAIFLGPAGLRALAAIMSLVGGRGGGKSAKA